MPSVATVAQFGSDLVRGALRSTLTQVQKNCSFLNLKQLSKKERRREKKLRRKLLRRNANAGGLVGGSASSLLLNSTLGDQNGVCPSVSDPKAPLIESEFGVPELEEDRSDDDSGDSGSELADESDNWFASNPPLDFVTEGPQVSAFTLSLREKYTCLNSNMMNSSPNGDATPSPSQQSLNSNNQVSSSTTTHGTIEPANSLPSSSSPPQSSAKLNGHQSDAVKLPNNNVSGLNGPLNKKLIQTNLTGFVTKTTASTVSPKPKNHDDRPAVSLPEPRFVLYDRNKIKVGWRMKLPIGCGFINLGNTCYMNATLQALFHTPAFVNWLVDELNDGNHKRKCERNTQFLHQCTLCPMISLVLGAYNKGGAPMRPVQIHNKLKTIGKNFGYGRQEDAHEFLRLLLESMERSYLSAIGGHRLDNRSKETTPLGQIFGGYTRGEVRCLTCRHVSTTFHPHAELQLDIREVNNVEDALAFYFQKERLDNNDYKCERCKTVQPATKQQFMELAPIVLCIQLKRFRACGSKIKKPIFVNERLNLRRFMYNQNDERCQSAEYKLVGLVTHMGPSPNCGHYTAIAQAQNGNYYHFDDSYVRMTSLNHAQNADAYVIIYETTDRRALESSRSSSTSSSSTPVSKPATTTTAKPAPPHATLSSTATTATKFIGPQLPPGGIPASAAKSTPETPKSVASSASPSVISKTSSPSSIRPKSPSLPNSPLVSKKPAMSNGIGIRPFSLTPKTTPLSPSVFQRGSILSTNRPIVSRPQQPSSSSTSSSSSQQNISSPNKQKVGITALVDYSDEEDENESEQTQQNGPQTKVSESSGESVKVEVKEESKKTYRVPSPPKIQSWNGDEESKLAKAMELDRKRTFLKTKEELEDEEIDSGRVKKKARSHSPETTTTPKENPFDKHSHNSQ